MGELDLLRGGEEGSLWARLLRVAKTVLPTYMHGVLKILEDLDIF